MSIAWVSNDISSSKQYDFLKIILSAALLNVLWVACLYYESLPSLAWNQSSWSSFTWYRWGIHSSHSWVRYRCKFKLRAVGYAEKCIHFAKVLRQNGKILLSMQNKHELTWKCSRYRDTIYQMISLIRNNTIILNTSTSTLVSMDDS